ncbi:MAG: hypothetical protein LQ345_004446 [Seirophora villosa]|nr:MAG: hypothetical protein LQ345_004446 [Seirophora villosa]
MTRARASQGAVLWELNNSGKVGRRTATRLAPLKETHIPKQAISDVTRSLNPRTASTKLSAPGGIKKQKAKKRKGNWK